MEGHRIELIDGQTQMYRGMGKWTDVCRDGDGQANRDGQDIDGQTEGWANREIRRKMHRQLESCSDRCMYRERDVQIDGQTETCTDGQAHMYRLMDKQMVRCTKR